MRSSFLRPVVLFGTLLLLGAGCATSATIPPQATDAPTSQIDQEGLEDQTVVRIDGSGYHPASVSVKKGKAVLWVNEDVAASHWPASDPHPTHTDYPTFDPKSEITPGNIWTFVFEKTGTWHYHDHLHQKTRNGYSVTVTE